MRELVQRHQKPIVLAAGLILVLAVVLIVVNLLGGGDGPELSDQVYFYDMGTHSLYPVDRGGESPQEAPSGAPGYLASVYGCDGCGDINQTFGLLHESDRGGAVAVFDLPHHDELSDFAAPGTEAYELNLSYIAERCEGLRPEQCLPTD